MNPRPHLRRIVQVRQIHARRPSAVVVLGGEVSCVPARDGETQAGVQLGEHAGVVDCAGHAAVADGEEAVVVVCRVGGEPEGEGERVI